MHDICTGACAGDIDNFCAKVEPGEQRLSACLTQQQEEEAKGNNEGEGACSLQLDPSDHTCWMACSCSFAACAAGKTLTEDCKAELSEFKIELGESINKNLPLGAGTEPFACPHAAPATQCGRTLIHVASLQ
jgi:Golgi apparatus protein 1